MWTQMAEIYVNMKITVVLKQWEWEIIWFPYKKKVLNYCAKK